VSETFPFLSWVVCWNRFFYHDSIYYNQSKLVVRFYEGDILPFCISFDTGGGGTIGSQMWHIKIVRIIHLALTEPSSSDDELLFGECAHRGQESAQWWIQFKICPRLVMVLLLWQGTGFFRIMHKEERHLWKIKGIFFTLKSQYSPSFQRIIKRWLSCIYLQGKIAENMQNNRITWLGM
jgi:hypothetical protein